MPGAEPAVPAEPRANKQLPAGRTGPRLRPGHRPADPQLRPCLFPPHGAWYDRARVWRVRSASVAQNLARCRCDEGCVRHPVSPLPPPPKIRANPRATWARVAHFRCPLSRAPGPRIHLLSSTMQHSKPKRAHSTSTAAAPASVHLPAGARDRMCAVITGSSPAASPGRRTAMGTDCSVASLPRGTAFM